MHLFMHRFGAHLEHTEAIELSKIGNRPTAVVPHDSMIVDTIKSLVTSARAIDLGCAGKFVGAPIKNIIDDTPISLYLPSRMRVTYMPHMQFAKLGTNDNSLLPFLGSLAQNAEQTEFWVYSILNGRLSTSMSLT